MATLSVDGAEVAKLLHVGMNVEAAIDTHLADVVAAQQQAGVQAAPVTNR